MIKSCHDVDLFASRCWTQAVGDAFTLNSRQLDHMWAIQINSHICKVWSVYTQRNKKNKSETNNNWKLFVCTSKMKTKLCVFEKKRVLFVQERKCLIRVLSTGVVTTARSAKARTLPALYLLDINTQTLAKHTLTKPTSNPRL